MPIKDVLDAGGYESLKLYGNGEKPVPGAFYAPSRNDNLHTIARAAYGTDRWRLIQASPWNQTHLRYTDNAANPCLGKTADPTQSTSYLSICASAAMRAPDGKWNQGQIWTLGKTDYPIIWIPTVDGGEPSDVAPVLLMPIIAPIGQGHLHVVTPSRSRAKSVYHPPTKGTLPGGGLFGGGSWGTGTVNSGESGWSADDLPSEARDAWNELDDDVKQKIEAGVVRLEDAVMGSSGSRNPSTILQPAPTPAALPAPAKKASVGWIIGGVLAATLIGTWLFQGRRKR